MEIKKFLADCLKCSKVRFKFKLFFKNKAQRSLVIHWKVYKTHLDFIFWLKSFKRYPGNFYNTHRLYFIVLGHSSRSKTDQELRNLGPRVFDLLFCDLEWVTKLVASRFQLALGDMYENIYPLSYVKRDKIYESILKITEWLYNHIKNICSRKQHWDASWVFSESQHYESAHLWI